jgi:hypothetical protein
MPAYLQQESERVRTHVAQEVKTPIGEVFVTYSPTRKAVEVSFHPRGRAHFDIQYNNDRPEMVVAETPTRPPAIGDEVTQNGRSFEVTGVRREGGRYMVERDGVAWEEWQA